MLAACAPLSMNGCFEQASLSSAKVAVAVLRAFSRSRKRSFVQHVMSNHKDKASDDSDKKHAAHGPSFVGGLQLRGRVHSGIRVHLTLRGHNSLNIYPIGTKCTSNAFFFHAEDGKNIFISLLHFGGGKLATPPPLRRLTDSGIRVSGGFSLLWRAFAVRLQTRTP